MMTCGLLVGSGRRVKTLDIAGLIDVDETGEAFSPDRSSNGLMARRDLGDRPSWYGRGSLIRRIRIRAASRVSQPVGSKQILIKAVQTRETRRGC